MDNSTLLLAEAQSETGWNSNQQGMDMLVIFTNQIMDNRGRSESMKSNAPERPEWVESFKA
jgi:hypothetical protein